MKFWLKNKKFKEFTTFKRELIIAVFGVILMIIPSFTSSGAENQNDNPSDVIVQKTDDNESIWLYSDIEAERLKKFLESIKGVGQVDVLLHVETSTKTINATEKNYIEETTDEQDSNGGERTNSKLDRKETYKVIKDNDGNESLIHIYDEYPEIKGVLISAEGADSNVVREMIIDAVSSLYDLPIHKISVVKKNEKK